MGRFRAATAIAAAGVAWGLFEAQRVRCRRLELALPRLPAELDGFSILHLSDLHLGSLSLNGRALAKAVCWAEARRPDLVAITGDLLVRQRGEPELYRALARLSARHGIAVVLGNVDVGISHDPFGERVEIPDLGRHGALLLSGTSFAVEAGGRLVQVAGCDAASRGRAAPAANSGAHLRILLSHYPEVVDVLPPGAYDLVLAGHTHGGQLCLPYPGGVLRLGDPLAPYPEGVFHRDGTTLVVSRGIGTTFVPFRFLCPPEVVEIVLRGPGRA